MMMRTYFNLFIYTFMINKIINILPIVQSLRQSEIQGKDKKQINTYICKYLCNVEMVNSNTGATEEEVEEKKNEEKVEILPVRKIVGNITLPDSIENQQKVKKLIVELMRELSVFVIFIFYRL